MTCEGLDRKHLAQALEDIRGKLSELVESVESTKTLKNELVVLGLRLAQLIKELSDSGTFQNNKAAVILVVDDNEELRTFIKSALELSDYTVLEASDADEALSLLEKTTVLDLILSDVMLPRMKGPDLVVKVRSLFPDVKVLFMSGYVSEDIVSQEVEPILTSGEMLLKKPFPTRDLLETVHDILKK